VQTVCICLSGPFTAALAIINITEEPIICDFVQYVSRYRALSMQSYVYIKRRRLPDNHLFNLNSTLSFPGSSRISSNASPTLFKAAEEKVLQGCGIDRSYEAGITKHDPERAFKPNLIHHQDRERESQTRRS
jgi:hypothetical protein